MKPFERIVNAVKPQLFATMPKAYAAQFTRHLFVVNTTRFATQSMVVVLMDICSLLFYLQMYRFSGVYYPRHIVVHLAKILLMLLAYLYYARLNSLPAHPMNFLERNSGVLYPCLHFLLEFALFASGPQDLGALVRLMAVPFIAGAIPIMRQTTGLAIQIGMYLIFSLYIPFATPYGAYVQAYAWVPSLWLVAFPCANLLSFTVYSWFVNNFAASMKESEARNQLSTLNEQLEHMSRHDTLTGLFNRRGFQQFMDATWDEFVQRGGVATVIMIDIDHFKLYNDRFGHVAGDECLHAITDAIDEELLDKDYILARYGGEEFIAVAYDQEHAGMVDHADRMRKKVLDLGLEHPDSDASAYVTVSLGVATQKAEELEDYTTLINWADECLCHAKKTGRNRIIHTEGRRGEYRDIHGVHLAVSEREAPHGRAFDDDDTQRLLRDIGANCTFVYDGKMHKLRFSAAAVQLFALPNSVLVPDRGMLAEAIGVPPEDRKPFFYVLNRCLENREPSFTMETHIEISPQVTIPVSITGQCSYGEDGQPEILFGAIISISKMVEYNHYLLQQSQTNNVTLLPNRNKLNAELKALLAEEDSHGYVVFMDIRDFKGINSYYSHSIGDKVLRETAYHLSRLAGSYLPAYNYDVDQFAIIAHGASKDDASRLMDSIYRHFSAEDALIEGLDLKIDLAIVAVSYTGGVTNIDQLHFDMDAAVQMIKYNPYQQYAFFDGKTREESVAKINLSNALKKSVENQFEGFILYYQPIIDAKGGACVGAEALLRWQDEQGNLVPPSLVVPVLEQSELMVPVEEWILNTACDQCHQWILQGAGEDFFININLSSAKIGRATLYSEVLRAVDTHGLTLKNITLEVTESSTLVGRRMAVSTLTTLYKQGVRIAIDDFGTGYSSLSYLNDLPANEIKIDRSFVDEVDSNPAALQFLSSIVRMVKSMGFIVCIEGVERETQHAIFDMEQVDYLQGYLYGMPSQPDAFFTQFIPAGKTLEE